MIPGTQTRYIVLQSKYIDGEESIDHVINTSLTQKELSQNRFLRENDEQIPRGQIQANFNEIVADNNENTEGDLGGDVNDDENTGVNDERNNVIGMVEDHLRKVVNDENN